MEKLPKALKIMSVLLLVFTVAAVSFDMIIIALDATLVSPVSERSFKTFVYLTATLILIGVFGIGAGIFGVRASSRPDKPLPALIFSVLHDATCMVDFLITFSWLSAFRVVFGFAMIVLILKLASLKPLHRIKSFKKATALSVAAVLLVTFAVSVVKMETHTLLFDTLSGAPGITTTAQRPAADGTVTVTSPYVSDIASSGADSKLTLTWNDAWFHSSSTVYNHELATTSMALSILANSEAQFYNGSSDTRGYLEDSLTQLGFTDIDTSSYFETSQSLDEIASVLRNRTDKVAYGFAQKKITMEDGSTKTLVLIDIRGTWGSEWLSDMRIETDGQSDDAKGFSIASESVLSQLESYTEGMNADDTLVLVCGHSRGGSVANLVAAEIDDRADGPDAIARKDGVWAYGFAVSRTTKNPDATTGSYDNIFSVNVPSDLVANIPLEEWGYDRYGVSLELPRQDSAGYDDFVSKVKDTAEKNSGATLTTDFYAEHKLDSYTIEEAEAFGDAEAALGFPGIAKTVWLGLRNEAFSVISCHYPDNYLAQMECATAGDLMLEKERTPVPQGSPSQ